jgi:hypothetical protein
METDPKKELEKASAGISGDPSGDLDELALKFLGLSVFYGASEKTKTITLQRSKDGKVLFTVDERENISFLHRFSPIESSIAQYHPHRRRQGNCQFPWLRNDRIDLTFNSIAIRGESFAISFRSFIHELGTF